MKSLKIGDLTVPVPVIQGGMGIGISLSGLASAVANMGGVGVIATVGIGLTGNKKREGSYKKTNIDGLREEIRKAREQSLGVIGVNIMSVLTNFSDMVRTSIEEGIDVIFSGAGLPLDLPKYLSDGVKTKLVPIVSSARAAAIICKKWKANYNYLPDAIVLEGPKAGGHLGFKANKLDDEENKLENLLSDVLQVTDEMKSMYNQEIPVIAGGGIFDGEDVYKILEKGASGVQMGTRFVATEECDADIAFKNAYIAANNSDIKIVKSPVGMPGRTIFNDFFKEVEEGKRKPEVCKHSCIKSCDPKTTAYCISEALLEASRGNLKDGFAFTGVNGARITKISTVKNVFEELKSEFLIAKDKLSESIKNKIAV